MRLHYRIHLIHGDFLHSASKSTLLNEVVHADLAVGLLDLHLRLVHFLRLLFCVRTLGQIRVGSRHSQRTTTRSARSDQARESLRADRGVHRPVLLTLVPLFPSGLSAVRAYNPLVVAFAEWWDTAANGVLVGCERGERGQSPVLFLLNEGVAEVDLADVVHETDRGRRVESLLRML